jgi:hypothetical protein
MLEVILQVVDVTESQEYARKNHRVLEEDRSHPMVEL